MKEQEKKKKSGRFGRKPVDLTELRQIPIIKEHLAKFAKTKESQEKYQFYLQQLRKILPIIKEKYGSFEKFLEIDENEKSILLMEYVFEQYEAKKAKKPDGNLIAFKNTYLRNIWTINGFLGKLGKKYKANPELLEAQTPNSNLELQVTLEDILKLYDVLPIKYKLILKFMVFSGLNPVDILDFRLADFKSCNGSEYFYIYKLRQKTKSKKVFFLNVYHKDFYAQVAEYARTQGIDKNEPIFSHYTKIDPDRDFSEKNKERVPITPKTVENEFRHYIKKHNLNSKTMPRYIRQLNATLLEDVLPSKYLLIWTQHKAKLMDRHYLKKNIDKFIEFYPLISKMVELKSSYQYSKLNDQKSQQKDINKEVLEAIELIAQQIMKNQEDRPMKMVETGSSEFVPESELQIGEKLQEILDKLSKLVQ
ncbi:MAG: hypothetical protein HWN65_08365 [Candidatus Helarchaeota archaeon]|nr:hypothetical protein [Candidatus Helarchaeota archaeon]